MLFREVAMFDPSGDGGALHAEGLCDKTVVTRSPDFIKVGIQFLPEWVVSRGWLFLARHRWTIAGRIFLGNAVAYR